MARQGTVEFDDRVEMLRQGVTQWGHDGMHSGSDNTPDCPRRIHHHHDIRCDWPTQEECAAAGVEWQMFWGSRAGGWTTSSPVMHSSQTYVLHWRRNEGREWVVPVPARFVGFTRLDANGGIA